MKTIYTYLTLFFISFSAQAGSVFSGLINQNSQGQYTLEISSQKIYVLASTNSAILQQISRLKYHDFLSIQAELQSSQDTQSSTQTLNVQSINYVGLSLLLGLWSSDDESCYFFDSYTTMQVYDSDSMGRCEMPFTSSVKSRAKKFVYFVNPDILNWYMVISTPITNMAAELFIFSPRIVQIRLFDEYTGDILSQITLRR